jgi:hydrogenase nickel incorporation protein HypA/HybF
MHELGIAVDIAELAAEEAARSGLKKVEAVHVRIGALSGVVKDSLLFAWPSVSKWRLEIEDAPGRELELIALEVDDDDDVDTPPR